MRRWNNPKVRTGQRSGGADALSGPRMPTVIVLPLSTQDKHLDSPIHVSVHARERFLIDSVILVEQPRTLDRRRMGDGPLTRLTPSEMQRVEKAMLAVLGVY